MRDDWHYKSFHVNNIMKPVIEFDCKDDSSKTKVVSCQYLIDDVGTAQMQRGLDTKKLDKLIGELKGLSGIDKIDKAAKELQDLKDGWKCGGKIINPPYRINYLQGLNAEELCNSLNSNYTGFTGSENAFPLGGSNQVCVEQDFIDDLVDSKNRCETKLKKSGQTKCTDDIIGSECLAVLAGESGVKTASKIIKEKFKV